MFVIVTTYNCDDDSGNNVNVLSGQTPTFVRADRAAAIAKAREVAARIIESEYDAGYATSFHNTGVGGTLSDDNLTNIAVYDEGTEDGGENGKTYGSHVANVHVLPAGD